MSYENTATCWGFRGQVYTPNGDLMLIWNIVILLKWL